MGLRRPYKGDENGAPPTVIPHRTTTSFRAPPHVIAMKIGDFH